MSSPQTDAAPIFSVRDGALAELQFSLMAQDMQWARVPVEGARERSGRTVVEVRFGDTWADRPEAARHSLCLLHHRFGVDMVGVRLRARTATLGLAPVMVLSGLLHRLH